MRKAFLPRLMAGRGAPESGGRRKPGAVLGVRKEVILRLLPIHANREMVHHDEYARDKREDSCDPDGDRKPEEKIQAEYDEEESEGDLCHGGDSRG